jgi:hypothetical protein
MGFHVYHRSGSCEVNPPIESFGALYDELATADDEHPCVSVEHESAWSLAAYPSGLVVWENVEDGEPCHMKGVVKDQVLHLWRLLSEGKIDSVNSQPWLNGYGDPDTGREK